MSHDSTPRQDARDLQAKLYREIGISAVAAALRFTTQPDPAPRTKPHAGVDKGAEDAQVAEAVERSRAA